MIYTVKKEASNTKNIVVDDMILTVGMPTTAGSKMLDGYVSLFESEALTRLTSNGYSLSGKVNVGEFAIDLLGESSYFGAEYDGDILQYPAALAVKSDASAAVVLDVNGAPRRGAAQSGLVSLKPTYGTVSRYGTVPVACSGETVSVVAPTAAICREVYSSMAGHDCKDGTSLPDCTVNSGRAAVTRKNKVVLLTSMLKGITDECRAKLDAFTAKLASAGIEAVTVDDATVTYAGAAWNILMSAELCNNVSRYDGVKFGYRSESFTNIDELYTNSRTEAFGELLKAAILFGSETLSTENYQKVYDKALRMRRVITENALTLLKDCDALLMPACSVLSYSRTTVESDRYLPYRENFYTAPSSITGLPAVVAHGVQLVGNAFSEELLLTLAEIA